MKTLYESILSSTRSGRVSLVKKWLDEHNIKNYTINDKCEIDVDGSVDLSYKDIEEFPPFIQFGIVKGYFSCSNNKLTSLKGAPKKVNGSFYCQNNKLTTLEGAPKKIKGGFYCNNNRLTSLKGAPEKVGEWFHCDNNRLTSLEGAPKEANYFNCEKNTTKFSKKDVRKVCKVEKKIYV